ncbi:uncharacterized protein LOC143547783 [Bidens hawaiensis]|uniref:uncharacterized protein LOC143547783 n=1 Tax=Bidens hawaiensis TaxID=980011 RepID=UPI00404908C6
MMKMELTSTMVNKEIMHDASRSDADKNFGYGNSQSGYRAGSGASKLDVGVDSQYEDGELREKTINAWKGYVLTKGQIDCDMNNIQDANETNSQNVQENPPTIKESNEFGPRKEAALTYLTPGAVLTKKLHTVDEALSGSGPNEMIFDQEKTGRQDNVQQHAASQSDEWKMGASGCDVLLENHRTNSNNLTKTRNFTARKFSYREEQKDRFDTQDVEMKAESPRFYRKESLTCINGPSTHDMFISRGRFQSSKDGDGLTSRPERESGGLRSFGRGRYSPHNRLALGAAGCGTDPWKGAGIAARLSVVLF